MKSTLSLNKNVKRVLIAFAGVYTLCVFALVLLNPTRITAETTSNSGQTTSNSGQTTSGAGGIHNPLKGNATLDTFFQNLLHAIFLLGTMVAVFFIIFAGFKYVTAGGDETAIKNAHQMLLYTAVGTAVLLGAQAIATLITNTVQQLGA